MIFDITSFINALAPSLGTGIFSSLIYAIWGKWANSEPFDTTKFLKTLVIGAFLGVLIALTGWSPAQAQDWLATALAGVGGVYGLSKSIGIVTKVKAQVSNGNNTISTSTTKTTTTTTT